MKNNYTHIALLLDRSASMAPLSAETITGVNTFIADQKKLEGVEATLSLATFASDYTLIHDFIPLKVVVGLTPETYTPRGNTSLHFSTGKLIYDTGVKLAAMPEENRPSKVVLVILTDGEENYSHKILGHEYTSVAVSEMISHQQEKYGWQIIYLGCTQDQIRQGTNLGILKGNTLQYDFTKGGIARAYATVGNSMSTYRSSASPDRNNFFDPQTNGSSIAPVVIPDPNIKIGGNKDCA
jgi:hypothetical protein